jgi:hypothetical protein
MNSCRIFLMALDMLKVTNQMKRMAATTLALALAANLSAAVPPELSQEHFGINLGMDLRTLASKCRQARVSADTKKWSFKDKDHPGRIIGLKGALSGNKAVRETKVSLCADRVYQIEVVFKDGSLRNYNVLKVALAKKYTIVDGSLFDAMDTRAQFSTKIDRQSVSITLEYDITYSEQGGTVSVSYEYDAIQKLITEEMNRRKASKVKDDL